MSTRPTEVTQIGPYRISERIGEGGMGVVYLASASDGELVSIKTLRPWLVGGDDGRRRFEREVATLRRVRGRRVAEVVDADMSADPPYMVTRYVRGTPLTQLVAERGPLHGDELHRLARGLLEALGSVHAAGVVHRDVKPANVLMSADGPVLIDFGIAHAAEDTRLTATGFISGTPGYLAPETVIGHHPTPATDLHGWAATLVFAATGRPPYGHGPDVAVLDRIRRGEHDLHGVDASMSGVLTASLQVDPSARPNVAEALQALDRPDALTTLALPPVERPAMPLTGPASGLPDTTDETASVPAVPPYPPQRWDEPPQPSTSTAQPQPQEVVHRDGRRRSWRPGLVVGLAALLLVFVTGWAPYAGIASVLGVLLLGRLTWRIKRRLFERRKARGPHKNDGLVAALAAPWDFVASVLPAVGLAALAAGCGLVVGGVLDLVDGVGGRTPYLGAAVVVLLVAWWGPGAVRSRHGVRVLVTPLDRAPRAAWATIAIFAVAVCGAVLLWESYGTVWWPADSSPSPPVPFFPW